MNKKKMPFYIRSHNDNRISISSEQFLEGIGKGYSDELLLCLLGEENPLINGKREYFKDIPLKDMLKKCKIKSNWDKELSFAIILEDEWKNCEINYGEEYGNTH